MTPGEDTETDSQAGQSAHDSGQHDVAAGEEFRQRGDWTQEDAGGPQVWDSDGNLVAEGEGAQEFSSAGAAPVERRISELDEVCDGGYGIGSAACLDNGAMPLGHSVKAWQDTMTYVVDGAPGYADAEPHLWFLDETAAQNAGFRPVV